MALVGRVDSWLCFQLPCLQKAGIFNIAKNQDFFFSSLRGMYLLLMNLFNDLSLALSADVMF